MNIWYIHPYAGSPKYGMSFRPYYLAKHFNKLGNKTTIVSSQYHHLCALPASHSGKQNFEDVDYFLQKVSRYEGNGFKRLKNMLSFGLGLFTKDFRNFSVENKPDVIIASTAHPFHLLAAKFYSMKYKAKLILEVRDIWPLSLNELVGVSKYHPLSILIDIFQRFGYKNCHHCVSLLANSESLFLKHGLKQHSFSYIPNGIELDEKDSPVGNSQDLVMRLNDATLGFKTVIGYTGALGIPNNLMPLIDAAKYLKEHKIAVLLVGDGIQKKELEIRVRELDLDNVIFFGKVSKDKVSTVIEYCDALFINAMPKEIYKYGVSPNKMFDYMIHNKIVFNGIESIGNPLEESGCEIRFSANDALDLSNKIIGFHNNKNDYKVSTYDYVRQHHTYKQLAQNYISIMEKLVN